jgi:GR25 family glycosyltransferase involved in LPS biosynthesis
LDRDVERWGKIHATLKSNGIEHERFPAILGSDTTNAKYAQYLVPGTRFITPPNALGCSLSHYMVIQKFYESGAEVALVLEDDAEGKPTGVKERIEHVLSVAPEGWEMIKLAAWPRLEWDGPIIRRQLFTTECSAYLINRRGAEKVMKRKIFYPSHVDLWLLTVCKMHTVTASYPTLAQTWETTSLQGSRYGGRDLMGVALNLAVVKLGPTNVVLLVGDIVGLAAAAIVVRWLVKRTKLKKRR